MLTFILIWFQQNTCRYPHIQINTLLEGLEKLCFVVFFFSPEMDINCLLKRHLNISQSRNLE